MSGPGRRGGPERPPLWTAPFRSFFVARTVSLAGDAMLQVALAVAVLEAGYGASGVGYALAAWTAPVALGVLFGGVLADRFHPVRTMVVADLARMVIQAVFAAILMRGGPTALWHVLALQATSGAATALFQPGVASLVPQVATDVQRANATLRVSEALTTLLGPALAGALLAVSGPGIVFTIDAASFGISAACLLALRLAPAAPAAAGALWRDLVAGWHEFRSRTWLWSTIAVWAFLALTVFGPTLPLGASLIVTAHGSGAYGLVMSAFGAGTVAGGLLGLRLRPARPLAAGATAMLAFALLPLVLATGAPVPVLAAGHFAAGAAFALWGVLWATTVQTHVPPAALSRVYAYDVAGSVVALPIGRALAGPAAQALGAPTVMAVSVAATVAVCAALLLMPATRHLRHAEAVSGEHALQEP